MVNIRIDWELTLEYWAVVAVAIIMGQIWLPDMSVWQIARLIVGQPGMFILLISIRDYCIKRCLCDDQKKRINYIGGSL